MVENMPVAVGSYVHYDRKLDGRIAQGVVVLMPSKVSALVKGLKLLKNLEAKFKMKFYIILKEVIIEDLII